MKGFFTIVVLLHCLLAPGAVRYVDIAATGANNGSSWLNASRDLQAMINLSVAGDEIYVAAGTYQPAVGASFRLKEGVKLYGGFPHGGDPVFADRNWMSFQTILRGDGVRRLFGNPMFMTAQTVLDGFHMTGGSSEQGGIAYLYDADIRIANCRFFDNTNTINQGGILFLNESAPVIQDCIFENNNSVAQGGVIVSFFSSPQISSCVFSNNRSTSNAGIINFLNEGAPVIDRCLFLNNTSRAGLLGHSGGTPFFSNCVFANNTGGPYCILSASSGESGTAITLAGCLIYNNTANNTSGGGLIYNAGGTVAIVNSTICNNNVSTSPTGSLFANVTTASVFSFVNTIIYNNVATNLIRAVNSGPPVFRFSIVQGMDDPANQVVSADPLFVDPANAIGPDNVWATADDGLELQPGSPAIDQGQNTAVPSSLTMDIKTGARILNSTVDQGAYEYVAVERPVVTTTPATTPYTVQQPPVTVDAGVTVTNTGSATLATGTVAIGAGFAAGDVLSFTNAAGMGNITGSYHAATGQLTLVSAGGTATVAQWQAALRAVAYSNTNASASLANRTVTFSVNDGRFSSNTATKTVVLQAACAPTTSTTDIAVCRAVLPYVWNGQTFTAAGSYVVHLTNAAGCDSAVTLVLKVYEATASLTRLTVCPTEFPFQWNGRDFATAGTYTVHLTNRAGCDSAATLELTAAGDRCLALKVATTPSGCKEASGTITATASGGTAPYQYSIDGVNYQAGNVFSGLASRSYRVSLKDADGTVVTVPVTVTADLCLDLVATPAGCGRTDGVIRATGTGGAAPYQYSIDGVNYQAGSVFSGLAAQLYNVTMKDATGLAVTVSVVVSAGACLNLQVMPAATTCGQNNGTITANAANGVPPYLYALNGGTYQSDNIFSGLAPGDYKVRVKDVGGLIAEVSANIAASTAAGRVSGGNNTSVLKNRPLQLNAVDVDNTGFTRFDWSPDYGLNRTDIANPVATIDKDVIYTVTATDPNGCKSTGQVTIKVIHNVDIYVPNAFTPNDDGRNDVLRALPFGISEFKFFAVYNRWGHRVFYTTDPRYGWDGSINGTRQGSGAFVWITEGIGMDGSIISRKGSVVLIR
ncbi:gliding motility-associated C-terminal domain-containing protein [Chitinophaga oryzae]|uniref:Gliding motility-associated C-terminal domain-containing protein n=1 Tax=Chitinophaga oryzae TaxID=2725414 RepID=A0ABX6L8R3_9BACT|nr:right-handed parallel beta-helix repeat-containing protein [Chitinophaga oryzae]QJB36402.1 gliding motility-associated C-terminal domain-containing protein [Chitinophaga oryzae]